VTMMRPSVFPWVRRNDTRKPSHHQPADHAESHHLSPSGRCGLTRTVRHVKGWGAMGRRAALRPICPCRWQ
jgi:hypothetical protein